MTCGLVFVEKKRISERILAVSSHGIGSTALTGNNIQSCVATPLAKSLVQTSETSFGYVPFQTRGGFTKASVLTGCSKQRAKHAVFRTCSEVVIKSCRVVELQGVGGWTIKHLKIATVRDLF